VAVVALLACMALCAGVAAAQEEKPEIATGEHKAAKKKNGGPRALGLLQMSANGKKSLVPIAILVNGKFWDASAYKADPVPMALEVGTVYEAERAGSSLGLFTVNSALHSIAVNAPSPWIGTGNWLAAGSEAPKTELKAETAPVGIDTGELPPRLTRDPTKVTRAPSTPASSSQSGAPSNAPAASTPSGSGDEPPRLMKPAAPPASTPPASNSPGSTPDANAPSSGSAGSTTAGSGSKDSTPPKTPSDAKPADSKPGDAKADAGASVPESDSGAGTANRPTLRRGRPVGPLPDDEIPGYSKPGATASAKSPADVGKAAEVADKGPVDRVPAISDAGGPELRSFEFQWIQGEEADRRKQMVDFAAAQVRGYVQARAKAQISPTAAPSAKKASAAKASAKPAAKIPDPILENMQLTTYDLWTTNQPIMVFSAIAHMPPAAASAAHAESDSELQYSVMIVAYPDIYHNLHKVYVGVTDKYHLDLTPRLELIDAVDADGDGRGELLFRETSDGGSGWVIYRATADKLWPLFDSLHPE
jgi:hypothetical protein